MEFFVGPIDWFTVEEFYYVDGDGRKFPPRPVTGRPCAQDIEDTAIMRDNPFYLMLKVFNSWTAHIPINDYLINQIRNAERNGHEASYRVFVKEIDQQSYVITKTDEEDILIDEFFSSEPQIDHGDIDGVNSLGISNVKFSNKYLTADEHHAAASAAFKAGAMTINEIRQRLGLPLIRQ